MVALLPRIGPSWLGFAASKAKSWQHQKGLPGWLSCQVNAEMAGVRCQRVRPNLPVRLQVLCRARPRTMRASEGSLVRMNHGEARRISLVALDTGEEHMIRVWRVTHGPRNPQDRPAGHDAHRPVARPTSSPSTLRHPTQDRRDDCHDESSSPRSRPWPSESSSADLSLPR